MKKLQDVNNFSIEIFLDKNNANLFNAIRTSNDALFEQRINYPVDLSTIQDQINPIQLAARLGCWGYVDRLIDHIKDTRSKNLVKYRNFDISIGEVLFQAVKAKQREIAEKLFTLIDDNTIMDAICWEKIRDHIDCHRDENQYTVLHWAAQHGYHDFCSKLTQFIKLNFSPYHDYNKNYLFIAKSKNNQNALDLAIACDQIHCAQALAKKLPFYYLAIHALPITFYTIFLKDIHLEYEKSANTDVDHRLIHKTQKKLIQYILQLPLDERKNAVNLLVTSDTMIHNLFDQGNKKTTERYSDLLRASLSPDFIGISAKKSRSDKSIFAIDATKIRTFFFHSNSNENRIIHNDRDFAKDHPVNLLDFESIPTESESSNSLNF